VTDASEALALLRKPFPEHQISKLPKPTKAQTEEVRADFKKGIRCEICGTWHHPKVVHLDYVGHAALTDRLLDADPHWYWEPIAFRDGLPAFDQSGGLWIKLTVAGVTRLGYGHAAGKPNGDPGAREKEVIGDALRNAAMRFGAALDLWHKGDLHLEEQVEERREPANDAPPAIEHQPEPEQERRRAPPLAGPIKTRAAFRVACGEFVRELHACEDEDALEAFLSTDDAKALCEQAQAEVRYYWEGDGADFLGLEKEIDRRRKLIAMETAA
jgi:hypothetical protein